MSKILYAHIWAYAPNMIDYGHKLGKYKYFSMKPTLYEMYAKTTPSLSMSAQHLLNCGFCGQIIAKKELNRP